LDNLNANRKLKNQPHEYSISFGWRWLQPVFGSEPSYPVYYINSLDVIAVARINNNQLHLWDVFGMKEVGA
jgi:hypothetical protein